MSNPVKKLARFVGDSYVKRKTSREFSEQSFVRLNERPVEYRFAFEQLSKLAPKYVLDVGTGRSALPSLLRTCGYMVSAIDNIKDYWPDGMTNRHFHVINDDIRNPQLTKKFEAVLCLSVLEHIQDHDMAVNGLFSLLAPGGSLILTFPFNHRNYVPNAYDLEGSSYGQSNPFVCQIYSHIELDKWLKANEAEVINQEYWQFFDGEFWTCGNQVIPPVQTDQNNPHQISCLVLRKKS